MSVPSLHSWVMWPSSSGTCLSIEEMRREGSRFERLELFTLRNVGQIAARQVELIKSCRPFSLGRRLFFFWFILFLNQQLTFLHWSTTVITFWLWPLTHQMFNSSPSGPCELLIGVHGFLVEISMKALNVHFDSLWTQSRSADSSVRFCLCQNRCLSATCRTVQR